MSDTPETQTDSTPEPKRPKGRTLQWLAQNPMIGLAGFIIGVVSLGLTIYFGLVSLKSRELVYYVNATRTVIVKSGQTSDLRVSYKGRDLSSDVTALQVAFWNKGKESIRAGDVLEPIVFSTSPKVPILEATIKQTTRRISDATVDMTQAASGSVRLSWRILEQNDGAVVQLIVAAPTSITVKAEGVIEGQNAPREVHVPSGVIGFVWLAGAFGCGLVVYYATSWWIAVGIEKSTKPAWISEALSIFAMLALLGVFAAVGAYSNSPGIPAALR